MDTSNLCTRCGADLLMDGYFCPRCAGHASHPHGDERLPSPGPDECGSRLNGRIEEFERAFYDEPVKRIDMIDEVLAF